MNVVEMLRRSGGLEAVSRQLGVAPTDTAAGAEALVPALVDGFYRHAETAGTGEGGLGTLAAMLSGLGGGGLAADVLGPGQTNVTTGNTLLGEIFGSREVSRAVAAEAAAQTGIDPEVLQRMLPLLAMLVGGYLSARAGGSGAAGSGGLGRLAAIFESFLADRSGSAPALRQGNPGVRLGDLLGRVGGASDKLAR